MRLIRKIFDFYGTQGLALTGGEEQEAIMEWIANPWAMEGIVNASKLPKFLAMELVKPILKTRGEMSSQAMVDLFINHNEMAYQRKITEHRLWVPVPTAGGKLTWLVDNGFINLEEISYDKKTEILEKIEKSKELTIKEVLPKWRKEAMLTGIETRAKNQKQQIRL